MAIYVFVNLIILWLQYPPLDAATVSPLQEDWRSLDFTNLNMINKESRKALLDIVTRELTTVRQTLDTLRPHLMECQNKTQVAMGKCMACVDNMCYDRHKKCKGRANVVVPPGGDVSVFGQRDKQGRQVVKVCALLQDNSKSCQTIMDPDSVMVSSIENMGDTLRVHLRGAVNDIGANSVGTFINGMQSFIGSYRPVSGNASDINAEELNTILTQMNKQNDQITQQVNKQILDLGTQIGQNMDTFPSNFNKQMQQFSSNMQNEMQKMAQSMNRMFQQNTIPPPVPSHNAIVRNIHQESPSPPTNIFTQPPTETPPFNGDINQQNRNHDRTPVDIFHQHANREHHFSSNVFQQSRNKESTTHGHLLHPLDNQGSRPLSHELQPTRNVDPSFQRNVLQHPDPGESRIPVDTFQTPANFGFDRNLQDVRKPSNRNTDIFRDPPRNTRQRPTPPMNNFLPPTTPLPPISSDPSFHSNPAMSPFPDIDFLADRFFRSMGEHPEHGVPNVINIDSPVANQISRRPIDNTPFNNQNPSEFPFHSDRTLFSNDKQGTSNPNPVHTVSNFDSFIGNQNSGFRNGRRQSNSPNSDVLNMDTQVGEINNFPDFPNFGNRNDGGFPNVLNINSRIGNQPTGMDTGFSRSDMQPPQASSGNIGNDMNSFASNLQRSLSNIFGGNMFGRKKRSVDRNREKRAPFNPGGIPITYKSNAGLRNIRARKSINKNTYKEPKYWDKTLRNADTNSVPVGGNSGEGMSVTPKSFRDNLSIQTHKSTVGPGRLTALGGGTAGGIPVYDTSMAVKGKNTNIPSVSTQRTDIVSQPALGSHKPGATTIIKPSKQNTNLKLEHLQTTTAKSSVMSTYPTRPLSQALRNVLRALRSKSATRSISAYAYDPTIGTTQMLPTSTLRTAQATSPTHSTIQARKTTTTTEIPYTKPPPKVTIATMPVTSPNSQKFPANIGTDKPPRTTYRVLSQTSTTAAPSTVPPPSELADLLEAFPRTTASPMKTFLPRMGLSFNDLLPRVTTPPASVLSHADSPRRGSEPALSLLKRTTEPTALNIPEIGNGNGDQECGIIFLNSTACLSYKQRCSACAEYIDSRKGDMMEKVCGKALVEGMVALKKRVTALLNIYQQVIASKDMITDIEFERTSGDILTLTFPKLRISTLINGKVVTFRTSFSLNLLNIPNTSIKAAEEIWTMWKNDAVIS